MSLGYINIIINSTIYTDHWPSVPNYSESQGWLRRIIFKYQGFVFFYFNEIKWADNLGNLKRSHSMTTFEINLPIDPLGESPLDMRADWPSTVLTILRTPWPSIKHIVENLTHSDPFNHSAFWWETRSLILSMRKQIVAKDWSSSQS